MKIKLTIYRGDNGMYIFHKNYEEYEIIEALKFKLLADRLIDFNSTYEVEIDRVEVE